jgi:formylmethanofuran dehydrogenase subunit E
MQDLQTLLERSCEDHDHLCPRQILGVRMGMAGLAALGFDEPPGGKQLLVISETDGCFVDGVIAATDCAVGHRTLRIEDYGKVAATFIAVKTGQAVRLAPHLDVRQRAAMLLPDIPKHYLAQMQAYQVLLESELFSYQTVRLTTPLEQTLSKPGLRVNCAVCGEEVMNEREVLREGQVLCRSCANGGYYLAEPGAVRSMQSGGAIGETV